MNACVSVGVAYHTFATCIAAHTKVLAKNNMLTSPGEFQNTVTCISYSIKEASE